MVDVVFDWRGYVHTTRRGDDTVMGQGQRVGTQPFCHMLKCWHRAAIMTDGATGAAREALLLHSLGDGLVPEYSAGGIAYTQCLTCMRYTRWDDWRLPPVRGNYCCPLACAYPLACSDHVGKGGWMQRVALRAMRYAWDYRN